MSVNLGLIGCGLIGRIHAECVAKIVDAQLLAYADQNKEAAQALLHDFGGDYATTDADRVFNDDRITAVYICTRHDSHAPLAIAAAKAGKHIMIEKPLALSGDDCQMISDVITETGVYLMPAFKMRFYPLVQKAHAFIASPQVLVGQMMDNRWDDDIWCQNPVQGGANVYSQGCHTTDMLRFLAGSEPKRIWAVGGAITHPNHPCIDQCVASIEFANGAAGSWIQGDAAIGQFTSKFFFELFGDGRSVQLYDRLKKATFCDGQKTWTEHRDVEEGYQLENEQFIAAIRKQHPPSLTVNDGIQAMRMVIAADLAIRTGQVQKL